MIGILRRARPIIIAIWAATWRAARFVILHLLLPWAGLVGVLFGGILVWEMYVRLPLPRAVLAALGLPAEQIRRHMLTHGSGFFISEDGLIVTARHVAEGCTMLAADDELGNVYPLAIVDRQQKADVALLQAYGARHHPYLALPSGGVDIRDAQWLVATGAPGTSSGFNPDDPVPMRAFAIHHLIVRVDAENGSRDLAAPYDWKRFGDLRGASGGPLTFADNRVLGVFVREAMGGHFSESQPRTWPADTPFVVFEPVTAVIGMLTPALWAQIAGSTPALRGTPITAAVRVACRSAAPGSTR